MRPHRNRGLFSNYYLDELLPKEEEFKVPISEVKAVFERVKGIWDRSRFEAINEDQLRKHFLDKVLDYLGWVVDVNAPVPTGEWSKRPDYAFFLNNETLKTAQKGEKDDYFKKVTCVAEAKRLGRPLDRKLKTEADPFEIQNPSLQISRYLWLTGVRWGILTDGKYWRLYERETSKRLDIFYEIDLEDLIESGSVEDFRYFYLLFRRDAFPEFIEKVYKGSVDYAEEVGEQLKENIYQALKTLAQGFLKTSGNSLSEDHLKESHDNSLILLYRLLFILYAEHRDLLPLGINRLYTESYSLDAFKKEVASRLDKNEPIATSTFGYWNKLKELFEIINKGNRELGVPPYNGGLFDPEKHNFLEKYRIGDLYVAKAMDLLSRSRDKAYIDYGSLEIRHLGSIYEGLLEYKLKIADQDLIPIKDKGKEVFASLAEAKKQKKTIREDEEVKAGEIYLVTDKGERKASGSYYTPEYIVKYIVENTIGPLVEERQKKVSENTEKLKKRIKDSRGANREFHEKELKKAEGSLIDEILSLKVLDPAMGSGHFLVEATDFLARELLKVLSGEPLEVHPKEMVISESSVPYGLKETEDEDIRWARREVVERCIFGVDLNPMAVELAKLSLWLYTVAKNRPLNFLDHHLRVGNSLIGAGIDDLASLPEFKKKKAEGGPVQLGLFESIFKEKVNILLGAFAQIEMLPSDTVEQVREKEKLYQNFRKIVSRFQDVADVWASAYFGNEVNSGNYQKLQNRLRSTGEEWERLSQEEWFRKAKEIANEKRFLHWELEFPEIFFEGHQRKENPGFDAVVGNPPYDVISEKEQEREVEEDRNFYLSRKVYGPSIGSKLNFYRLFICCSLEVLRQHGMHGFIVPMALLGDKQARDSRKFLLEKNDFIQIEAFPQKDDPTNRVFYDAKLSTCVYIVGKSKPSEFMIRIHPGKEIIENSPKIQITYDQIEDFDKENLSIPCYPGMTTQDFQLALKIIRKCEGNVFGNYVSSQQGEVNLTSHSGFLSKEPKGQIVLRGAHVDRYEFQEEPKQGIPMYLNTQKFINAFGKNTKAYDHQYLRVGYQRGAAIDNWRRIIATIIEKNNFCSDTINYIVNPNHLGLFAVLALLNASLSEWRFRLTSTNNHVNAYEIDSLPVPYISFVTPRRGLEKLFDEAKNHYKKYIETLKPDTFLYFIDSRLLKEHKPDLELVKKHNATPLYKNWKIPEGALWEQSDVVHDILAFLAEQMIEMNKEEQREIKGYLKWLESQLKIQSDTDGNTDMDALTGKTQIKNYIGDYQKGEGNLSFEEFWKILEKNRNRIQTNLKSRELYENIKSEYEKSLSKLLPLKEKLRKTDWLIDQIVYRLYGLTEEEVEIVERSYS
jgi:Alw26I/Eco31I/Esp3I family type II restriction m6 adenine DNA methyltransferase